MKVFGLLLLLVLSACGPQGMNATDLEAMEFEVEQSSLELSDLNDSLEISDAKSDDVVMGDMILSKGVHNEMFKPSNSMGIQAAKERHTWTWNSGVIPIRFQRGIKWKYIKRFYKACEKWGAKSTVKCIRHTNQKDYVYVTKNKKGCYSYLGRVGGKQVLNLGKGCWSTRIILHEIGHAMGMIHEHQRPDRDKYVRVYWSNIDRDKRNYFSKSYVVNTYGPYDFNSIMHYDSKAFAKRKRYSILKYKTRGKKVIKAAKKLSHYDLAGAGKMYPRRLGFIRPKPPKYGYKDPSCKYGICP